MEYENRKLALENEIYYLISLQQEGGYWDFKREWHTKKYALLHDIICMANNLNNRDAYIIIGVDEEKEFEVTDVRKDPNRKNTQKLVDFLKDKKFAGGIRPLVHVEQMPVYEGFVDVIVIENSHNTPFYLTEQYESVKANHIYTRVMDTNTPVDKSADINNIEYLWRKRFYLDETPLERIANYLKQPQDWTDSPIEFDLCKFYKYSPEFVMRKEPDETRTRHDFYFYGQIDTNTSWYTITLYYYQTALEQFLGVSLDGGRCFVVAPRSSGIMFSTSLSYCRWDVSYRYYIKDSLEYTIIQLFRAESMSDYENAFLRLMRCVLLFQSKTEKELFDLYVKQHEEEYNTLYSKQGEDELPNFPSIEGYNMDELKKDYRNALVMQKMLAEFRTKI